MSASSVNWTGTRGSIIRKKEEEIMRKLCRGLRKTKRGPYPNPMTPRVDFKFKDWYAEEKSLMRHSWYRRLKAKSENADAATA
jgi:hypothetical protein